MEDITANRLKEVLHYNDNTGVFTWISPSSNRVSVGDTVKTLTSKGYLKVGIDGTRYPVHRLAFLYMTGNLPTDQVDHVNGNKTDNRWSNLRLATGSQNQMNRGTQANNTSGVRGVTLHKRSGRWLARVKACGVYHNLGYYDDINTAAVIVAEARKRLHGEFNKV